MPIDLPICLPIHQSVEMVVNVNLEKLVKENTEILFAFLLSFVSNPNAFFSKKKKREGEIKGKEGRRGGRKERGREEGIKKRMRNNLISSPATLIKAGKDFIRSQSMMDSMA